MQTNPLWDRIRAEARGEGRQEGRTEGMRAMLLELGRQKFRKRPSRKQQEALDSVTDREDLEALAKRLLEVDSWAELLNGNG